MHREKRRKEILNILNANSGPISGTRLSEILGVSRQIIVGDIAILKVTNKNIISTSQGYILNKPSQFRRVFKVRHNDVEIEDELNTIVDAGGVVIDVFVEHKLYGKIKTELLISSRYDVKRFLDKLRDEKASPLKELTGDYHYHTVEGDSNEILNIVEEELKKKNYLVS